MKRIAFKAAVVCLLGGGSLLSPRPAAAAPLDCGPWCADTCTDGEDSRCSVCGTGSPNPICVEPGGGCTDYNGWHSVTLFCEYYS